MASCVSPYSCGAIEVFDWRQLQWFFKYIVQCFPFCWTACTFLFFQSCPLHWSSIFESVCTLFLSHWLPLHTNVPFYSSFIENVVWIKPLELIAMVFSCWGFLYGNKPTWYFVFFCLILGILLRFSSVFNFLYNNLNEYQHCYNTM